MLVSGRVDVCIYFKGVTLFSHFSLSLAKKLQGNSMSLTSRTFGLIATSAKVTPDGGLGGLVRESLKNVLNIPRIQVWDGVGNI